MKNILRVLGSVLLIFVFVVVTLMAYLTVDDFKPEAVESLEISGESNEYIKSGAVNTIMTWNIGYGALGDNADFFLDGGKMVYSADEERVLENLKGISDTIAKVDPDILFLQEMDRSSSRSYFIDEMKVLNPEGEDVFDHQTTFAPNYKVSFVPLPIPPIGKVYAGLGTASKYKTDTAERIQLPVPYKWPLSTVNLKRCLAVSRLPLENSDKELILVNLHLEAYDSGEGKIAQTNMLKDLLVDEFNKGNYVIAGGDFNQVFSDVDTSAYPQLEGTWEAGYIDMNAFGDYFNSCTDNTYPTCRLLNRPLDTAPEKDPQHFQYYLLDGFIVSSNVSVESIETLNLNFKNSDHNPLVLKFTLN